MDIRKIENYSKILPLITGKYWVVEWVVYYDLTSIILIGF